MQFYLAHIASSFVIFVVLSKPSFWIYFLLYCITWWCITWSWQQSIAQKDLMPVWIRHLCFHFSVFLFFFFSRISGRQNLLFTTVASLFMHCSSTIYALFMGPTTTLFRKKIKNWSHDTIHTFKNYFVTIFSVFSFSKNKFNPNGPLDYFSNS